MGDPGSPDWETVQPEPWNSSSVLMPIGRLLRGVARFAYEICGAPHGKGRVILSVHREDVRGGSHLPLIIYLFLLFAGQFLEELSKFSSLSYKLRTKSQERETEATKKGLLKTPNPRTGGAGKYGGGGLTL